MFDMIPADEGRRARPVRRVLLVLVATCAVAYLTYTVAPRLSGYTPRALVLGRSEPAQPVARLAPPPRRQGGFGGGFGGQQELALVAQFDRDGDERLNTAERLAARQYLRETQRRSGRFGFGSNLQGPTLAPGDVTSYQDASLYDAGTLRTIFLTFENADWERELMEFYRTDVEVPATMSVDGRTYRDVGVHFRGNSSFGMIPEGRKHSFQLTVDWVHEDQQLHGYRTLNLLNANQDPTFLRAVLFPEIARDYIPAAKTNFMRVVINGESWGVYPNIQVFNKDFTRDWFQSTKGARWRAPGNPRGRAGLEYLGDDPSAYKRIYEIRTKDDDEDWAALIRMMRVLNETPPDRLEAALAPILDVDGALRFLALDNALVNNDGYWSRASDYNIYLDERGRFHVLPHDINETLNVVEGRGPGGTAAPRGTVELDPLIGLDDGSKPLRSKLLAVPSLRARYLRYVRDIAEKWLDWDRLGPIALRYQTLIAADVRTDAHKLYGFDDFDAVSGGDSIKRFVDARRAYLLRVTDPR